MPTKVLVRPDGSTVRVNEEDAPTLAILGYKEQTPEQARGESIASAQESYYTTPSQKFQSAIEGGLAGASFGLTDLGMNDEAQERAKFNPGYRIAGELLGGFVAPVGPLGSGAAEVAEGMGIGRTGQALAKGVAEGAAFGAGGAITQAKINGDPLTAESIIAGAGWGSLYGGALSSIFSKSADLMEGAAARASRKGLSTDFEPGAMEKAELDRATAQAHMETAVSQGIKDYDKTVDGLGHRHYREFRMDLNNTADQLSEAVKTVQQATEDVVKPNFSELKAADGYLYNWLLENGINDVRGSARGAEKALKKAIAAGKVEDYGAMAKALETYQEHVGNMAEHFDSSFPLQGVMPTSDQLLTFAKDRFSRAQGAAETLGTMTSLSEELRGLPDTTSGFTRMTGPKVERVSAALDAFNALPAAELSGLKQGLGDSMQALMDRLGVTVDGDGATVGSKFRALHETLKEVAQKKTQEEMAAIARGKKAWGAVSKAEEDYSQARMKPPDSVTQRGGPGIGKRAVAFAGGILGEELAKKAGAGGFMRVGAYMVSKHTVSALLGIKGHVMGGIADAVKSWGPRTADAIRKVPVARYEPLKRRITGELDRESNDKVELMQRRAEEIRSAAPTVRDVLYRNIAPMGVENPELASAMHELAAQQFAFILNKLPQDPGGAYSGLKSLWSPDSAAALKFERYYATLHDPVGQIKIALSTGKVTPELTEGLREMYPSLYSEMKADMLMRLSDPRVWQSMNYSEQVNIGLLLGFPVHSTMRPQFIAAQSQMFQERNNPQTIKPQAGQRQGGGGGRPPGPGDGQTQAQRITEH